MKFHETKPEGAEQAEALRPPEVNEIEKTQPDASEALESSDNRAAFQAISKYYGRHNYGPEHFKQFSQDPEWRQLFREAYPDKELPPIDDQSEGLTSKEYRSIVKSLEEKEVDYRPITRYDEPRTSEEIVERISGRDRTGGSCSSMAFAYAGCRAGYDVLDYRGGESKNYFSLDNNIEAIAELPGVESKIIRGNDDFDCAHKLQDAMVDGKEYYFATGKHAAIVRKTDADYEYLELQKSSIGNGWQSLDDSVLRGRFLCSSSNPYTCRNFLIDIDSLGRNAEFRSILGFINTNEENQKKGAFDHVG